MFPSVDFSPSNKPIDPTRRWKLFALQLRAFSPSEVRETHFERSLRRSTYFLIRFVNNTSASRYSPYRPMITLATFLLRVRSTSLVRAVSAVTLDECGRFRWSTGALNESGEHNGTYGVFFSINTTWHVNARITDATYYSIVNDLDGTVDRCMLFHLIVPDVPQVSQQIPSDVIATSSSMLCVFMPVQWKSYLSIFFLAQFLFSKRFLTSRKFVFATLQKCMYIYLCNLLCKNYMLQS